MSMRPHALFPASAYNEQSPDMRQATVIVCCYGLLEVIVQLVDMNHHVLVQHRRGDISHLFADQTEILQVGFQTQLFTFFGQ